MASITITINCDNAAFGDDANERADQVVSILRCAADRQEQGFDDDFVHDDNGNRVGTITYENWTWEE